MKRDPVALFSAFLFATVSFAHLLRILFDVPVMVADTRIPMWISGVGVVVPGILAWLLLRGTRQRTTKGAP